MKPASFAYHRVGGVSEAIERLEELGEDSKVLAGGQSLVPMMNFRLARPAALVDISRVQELKYLEREGDTLRIGAMTPHSDVEAMTAPELLDGFGVLKHAARWVGHYPIRTRGTFGGSVAHADPSAEWCMLAVLLDAEIVARGPGGDRTIAAADFLLGFLTNALDPDEILIEVRFPRPAPHAALQEFARRRGDFAIVAAAVALDVDGEKCRDARIVIGGVDDVPVRASEAEAVLAQATLGTEAFQEAGQAAAKEIEPASDIHGSAEYRRHLAAVLVARALAEAAANGNGST
jgi:carbon-monoxide dehydrogenase medium subunit